jgi:capsular polysaccharide biosynthesis protein
MEDIAQAFLKRPGVILLVVLGFVGPTLGFSLLQPSVYEASAKLMVGQKQGAMDANPPAEEFERLQQTTLSVVEAIENSRRTLAAEAIQRLGLQMKPDQLLDNLTVEQMPGTYVIELSYKDTNPERAQRIANYYVAEVTVEGDIPVTVWEAASVPSTPVRPDPVRNAVLALILGLAVGPVLAIWMDERTKRERSGSKTLFTNVLEDEFPEVASAFVTPHTSPC